MNEEDWEQAVIKLGHWTACPVVEHCCKNLECFKKVGHHFPPSFLVVWVKVRDSKGKHKAWFDAPNRRWVRDGKTWTDKVWKNVFCWKEIRSYKLIYQIEEASSQKIGSM